MPNMTRTMVPEDARREQEAANAGKKIKESYNGDGTTVSGEYHVPDDEKTGSGGYSISPNTYPILVQPPIIAVQQTIPTAPIPRPKIHGKEDDVCCACVDHCTAVPSTETRDISTNSILRINFTYWDRHWCTCGPHPGVAEQDQRCPEEVIQAAIVNCGGKPVIELKGNAGNHNQPGRLIDVRKELSQIWHAFLGPEGNLYRHVQQKHLDTGTVCMFPIVFLYTLLLVLTCGLCCQSCKIKNKRVKAWDQDLRKWQLEFNKAISPFGLFVKTQTHCWVTISYDGDGRPQKNRHFRRWIALALTPEQSALLAGEPHISGDVEVDLCCGGVNELALSMHPPNGMLF
ncbi:unnamed protein product [Amoebophrya sp. A120]|nr:unnamed protein product [Amoebophrya sp. A120]|eukprot:GSA120T00022568001.1